MAGTIIADDLQHSNNDTVGTEYVINGSAKHWITYVGTSTISISDSFNASSITDNGTGQYTTTLSNAMNNSTFSNTGSTKQHGSNDQTIWCTKNDYATTTTTYRADLITQSGGEADAPLVFSSILGDLA